MINKLLRDRIIKASTIADTDVLTDSVIFNEKDMIHTDVPMINVALSGMVDGGLISGITMLAGPSKHFKTAFALLMASAFLKKYDDGMILFYDNEFGAPKPYFETYGIDMSKVIHTPIISVEQFKFDIVAQLDQLERSDHVLIVVDSIGNLASVKEIADAQDQKSVADMTRAKQLKSVFRIVTPNLTIKDIPMIVVNHTYSSMDLFPHQIVSGGTGSYYNSNDIWIIGRQQDKEQGKELEGFHAIINIEKSRTVKEKSKIPITVSFKSGIQKWSGLFDLAKEAGLIEQAGKGWWKLANNDSKFREDDVSNDNEFWEAMLANTHLKQFITDKYKLVLGKAE